MNNKMKQVCHEIQQGNNLEVNLPHYFNRLVTLYEQYGTIKFTMYYYTFYENYLDSKLINNIESEQLLTELNQIIQGSIITSFSGEKMVNSVQRLNVVRNHIMNQLKMLTAYTDMIQNYEYVLNRIEYRFDEDIVETNEEKFVAQVLRYIFDTKDNVIINDKIKEVIGQFPIRMTKSKYFELLRESISIYKGADKSAFDTYIYMIKTGAMLYSPEGMDTSYPELLNLRNDLEKIDFKNMTKEEYLIYNNRIKKGAALINEFVDFYYGLQEVVNHLYVMLLTEPYAYMESHYQIKQAEGELKYLLLPHKKEDDICKVLITAVNEHFLAKTRTPIGAEIEAKLSYTEGKQELLLEEFEALEPILSDIKTSYGSMVESLMLGRLFHCLNISQSLLGNSLFIELDHTTDLATAINEKVDDEYLTIVQDELLTQLSKLFSNSSKNITRAVMANTMNKMPVFFQSPNEVMDYLKNSFDQCHDLAEKTACIQIIKSFLEN